MSQLVPRIRETTISDWQRKIRGHARRIDYYKALDTCLETVVPGTVFTGADARHRLAEEVGVSSGSTLYNLVGDKKQKYPSLRVAVSGTPLLDLLPAGAVEALIAEAKVWSHWPHREGWLAGLAATAPDDRRWAATTLISRMADWAARTPRLAAAEHAAAPLIAVQDLCLILDGEAAPADAAALLARVVELAAGPLGTEPDTVLDTAYDDLMRLGFEHPRYVRDALSRAGAGLGELAYLLNRVDGATRGAVADRLEPVLAEIMRLTDPDELRSAPQKRREA
ncbi:hypothetical protein E1264_32460 [Actinomadura sp. KC216]|uniref:hypothetical protein n=1 Tax=Actinomadura sp. KC216 TaxID=2530370 RepID=UPI00104B5666|nr:hypothetical protein [Actinomadura sp. KC216]TDB81653.1 hypothetical protein E1264_32460 [Actinomadura sp. KC216]